MRHFVVLTLLSGLLIAALPRAATAENKRSSHSFAVGAPKELVEIYVSALSNGEKPSPQGFIQTCCGALGAKHRSRRAPRAGSSLHKTIKSCDVRALSVCVGLARADHAAPKVEARRLIAPDYPPFSPIIAPTTSPGGPTPDPSVGPGDTGPGDVEPPW